MAASSEAIDAVKTKFSSAWTAANTDSITPTFALIYDIAAWDLGTIQTYVAFYTRNTNATPTAVGTANVNEKENISINIRTAVSRAHALKCLAEVIRIIKANRALNDTHGHFLVYQNWTDHSDKRRLLWEFTVEVEVRRWNV